MRICDVCYAEITDCDGEICEICKNRKPANILMEEQVSYEEVVGRFIELMETRKTNIELLREKLISMSKKYDVI